MGDILGIGQVIGSIIDGGISMINTANNNATSKKIAKDNREWQSDEAQKSRDYATDMYERALKDNSPSAIMSRYRDAGLNPFLSDNSVPAVSAMQPSTPSVPSSPSIPSLSTPRTNFADAFRGVALSGQQRQVAIKTQADAQGQIVDNAVKMYETFGKDAAETYLDSYAPFMQGGMDDSSLSIRLANARVVQAESDASLTATSAQLEKQFGADKYKRILWQFDQDYAESVARIAKMSQDSNVNKAKIEQEILESAQRIVESLAKTANIRANTETANALREWTVSSARSRAASDFASALEDESVSDSRSNLRKARKTQAYKLGVTASATLDETVGGRLADAIGDVVRIRAAKNPPQPPRAQLKRKHTTHHSGSSTTTFEYE